MSKDVLERFLYFKRELEKIVDDFLSPRSVDASVASAVPVSADVTEDDSHVRIDLDLPGIDRTTLEVSISNEMLVVNGEKPNAKPSQNAQIHCIERTFGKFQKIVPIGRTGDLSQVTAQFSRGVLTVLFPKITERRGMLHRVNIE